MGLRPKHARAAWQVWVRPPSRNDPKKSVKVGASNAHDSDIAVDRVIPNSIDHKRPLCGMILERLYSGSVPIGDGEGVKCPARKRTVLTSNNVLYVDGQDLFQKLPLTPHQLSRGNTCQFNKQ